MAALQVADRKLGLAPEARKAALRMDRSERPRLIVIVIVIGIGEALRFCRGTGAGERRGRGAAVPRGGQR